MRYLTVSELIYINGRLLNNAQIMTGKQKVRDLEMLEAAAARPTASAFGADAYPTLREKAAALLHSLARNHPFTDGNKRTAAVAGIFMLRVNGHHVIWNQTEALDVIVNVAANRWTIQQLADWLTLEATDALPEPDADRDIREIDAILSAQKWLLDELAGR